MPKAIISAKQKNIYQSNFQREYSRLNEQQLRAVDTIEGPVMVIAGAGTGKTQTIALRIANILSKTQTPPSAILCLTFTETAASNMRNRLISIIGPSAYLVRIHTFHSFCNDVIQSNPDNFVFAKDIQALEDLEKIEFIQALIDQLATTSPLKPWGDPYYYQKDITSHIQTLKRENISPQNFLGILQNIQTFLEQTKSEYQQLKSLRLNKDLNYQINTIIANINQIPNIPVSLSSRLMVYQQYFQSGLFDHGPAKNPAVNYKNTLIKFFDSLHKDLPKQFELQHVYQGYQDILKNKGRYDFDDMILFVLNAFNSHPDLLLAYQEQFQYILVDEYQDTNSAQNQIIQALGSYFDNPNIFVVGDDDQSIFRFQGASIENIYQFYEKYLQPLDLSPIVLTNNYRSHQLILDSSSSVISYNKNRIANHIKNLDKSLVSNSTFDPTPINLFSAANNPQESLWVSQKIKHLLESGVDPNKISILYRNNQDQEDIVSALEKQGIKYHLAAGGDILKTPLIHQIIKLLTYINDPSSDDALFQILSYPFLKIPAFDLFKILRFSKRQGIPISEIISSPQTLSQIDPPIRPTTQKKLKNFTIRIAKALRWLQIYNLDKFFNRIIRKFGYLDYLLKKDDVQSIIGLNTLYSEIRKILKFTNPSLKFFLERLDLYQQNGISLSPPSSLTDTADSVQLMTVHKAKGLEFEHVFIYKCIDKKWGNSFRYSSLKLPPGILATELFRLVYDDNEDERRLFYVALTRAQKQLYISFSQKSDTQRDQLPSIFITEIRPDLIENVLPPPSLALDAAKYNLGDSIHVYDDPQLRQYLKEYLGKNYIFNVTHLNSYLRCPFCFYYKTILKIPRVRDKYSSLGNAIHASLSYFHDTFKTNPSPITRQDLMDIFQKYLKKEHLSKKDYQDTLKKGQIILTDYYEFYLPKFIKNCITDYDFSGHKIYLDGIPVTGKIDKIEILDKQSDGKNFVNLVDFKTGNPDNKSKDLSPNGDYFRQLVFYHILAQLDPQFTYHVNKTVIDFVQKSPSKNQFIKKEFTIEEQDIVQVQQLIKDVYRKIINLDFNHIGEECQNRDGLHQLLVKK